MTFYSEKPLDFDSLCVLSMEVCQSSIIMCPRCDKRCVVWQLSDTCAYAKVSSSYVMSFC